MLEPLRNRASQLSSIYQQAARLARETASAHIPGINVDRAHVRGKLQDLHSEVQIMHD